jgi:integrase
VLLYDLTSTYFECDPPEPPADPDDPGSKKKFGYSRDKRPDCVQVVIALIVTPEGFPVAYEVMPGNTSDKTTLPEFLRKIEAQYGKVNRLWIMDRGIPTEEALEQMRPEGASYLVGTPRGRVSRLEDQLFSKPWENVRGHVEVKLARDGEDLYVLTRSGGRCDKERSMRRCPERSDIDRSTAEGKRDSAIICLLAVYGVRGVQIRCLRLDDIDWRNERIHFPAAKGGRPIEQHLLAEAGNLLAEYVRHARPESECSEVFLTLHEPFCPLPCASYLSGMVKRRIKQLGLVLPDGVSYGTHGFRHAFASRMVGKVPFKDLADQLNLGLPNQPPPRLEELKKRLQ